MFSRELKKGSTELLLLSLLEDGPRHGYDIGKRIEERSGGKLRLRIASLDPASPDVSADAGSSGRGSAAAATGG